MAKRKTNKFFCIALSLILLISNSVAVFAQEIENVKIDEQLIENGYPQMVLDILPEETKQKIYNNNLYFAGGSFSYYDEDSGTFTDINIEQDDFLIQPRGQISTEDLQLSFVYSASYASSGKLEYIEVTFLYNWLNLPVFRWQDPIAITWDEDVFEMQSGSFYKVDYYDGMKYNGTGTYIGNVIGAIHSEEYGYASASPAGVTWYADLAGYLAVVPTRLYGGACFILEAKNTTYSGNSRLYSHYVHPTMSAGVDLLVDSYGNISISGGSNYHERGTDTVIRW